MFGRRKIQVDLVKEKKAKDAPVEKPGPSFQEKAAVVAGILERGIRKLTVAAVVVILADTVRRVATEQASQQKDV